VHDVPGVQVLDCEGDLEAGLEPLRQGQRLRRDLRFAMQQLRKRTTEAKLKNKGRRIVAIDPEDAQEPDDVGVVSLAQDLCLTQEPLGGPGFEALHGDFALHAVNGTSIHLAEASLANFRDRSDAGVEVGVLSLATFVTAVRAEDGRAFC